MSAGGAPSRRRRAELIARLSVLRPRRGDVLLLRVPDGYRDDSDAWKAAQELAGEAAKATGRVCFILTPDEELTAERVQEGLAEKLGQPPARVG